MRHTPGPWRSNPLKASIKIDSDVSGLVATIPLPAFIDDKRRHADARLIAAAPDLLAALKKTVGALWSINPATTSDGCYTDDPVEKQARAAIAKATQ
jgi:hypothetical protein